MINSSFRTTSCMHLLMGSTISDCYIVPVRNSTGSYLAQRLIIGEISAARKCEIW